MIEYQAKIDTADGTMPTFVVRPDGSDIRPGIIVYMDVFGFREELFDICRRFAASGYVTILPHLFYRLGAPDFAPPNRREDVVHPAAQEANGATSIDMTMRDIGAVTRFLDIGGAGRPVGQMGTIGYCMGGRHALAAAVAAPGAIGAAASIHGGRLVSSGHSSPHLLLSQIKVKTYIAFAKDDGTCPDADQKLVETTAAASGHHIKCEKLNALHGWSFPDRWCFDRVASNRVWEYALDMFGAQLWTKRLPLGR